MPATNLPNGTVATNHLVNHDASALVNAIARGQNPASTDAEIETAMRDLAERWADERANVLAKVNDLHLSDEINDALKSSLLQLDKAATFNLSQIANAALTVSTETLFTRLSSGASKNDIYSAMAEISSAAHEAANEHFAALRAQGKVLDPDDVNSISDLFIQIVVLSRPQQYSARRDSRASL